MPEAPAEGLGRRRRGASGRPFDADLGQREGQRHDSVVGRWDVGRPGVLSVDGRAPCLPAGRGCARIDGDRGERGSDRVDENGGGPDVALVHRVRLGDRAPIPTEGFTAQVDRDRGRLVAGREGYP